MNLRPCTPADAEDVLRIYEPYVERTAITFDLETPSLEEFRQRIVNISARYPYLVAEEDGRILGYAYASAFHSRHACDHCAEMAIYLVDEAQGRGIGRALYASLERQLRASGIRNLYVRVAWTEHPDEHLDNGSEAFHLKCGYTKVAHLHRCAYKFGRYYDLIYMEKFLDI